jgi:putative acetyltransferase
MSFCANLVSLANVPAHPQHLPYWAREDMHIQNADSPEFVDVVRILFREYEASIKVDLCFQGFEKELAGLPGEYARPRGRLLLAFEAGEIAGCGALRGLQHNVCEMKRLYVRPAQRGKAIGVSLARALIENAKTAGYATMRLDTMPSMTRAIALYRSLGFREIEPYRVNPVPGALFFELDLREVGAR